MPRGVREKQVGGAKLLVNDAEERLERVNKKKESFLADSKDQEIQAEEIASVGDVESSIEQFEVTPDNNTKRFLSIVLLLKLISDSGKYNKTTTKGNDKLDNKLITILLKATQNSGGKNNGDNNKDSVNIVKIFIILKYLLGFESLDVKYKKIVLEKLKKMLEDLGVENVLLQRINNKPIDDAIEFCKRLLKNLKR